MNDLEKITPLCGCPRCRVNEIVRGLETLQSMLKHPSPESPEREAVNQWVKENSVERTPVEKRAMKAIFESKARPATPEPQEGEPKMIQSCPSCDWSDEDRGQERCPVCGYDLSAPEPTRPEGESLELALENLKEIEWLVYNRGNARCLHCDADVPRGHRTDCPARFFEHARSYIKKHRRLRQREGGEDRDRMDIAVQEMGKASGILRDALTEYLDAQNGYASRFRSQPTEGGEDGG